MRTHGYVRASTSFLQGFFTTGCVGPSRGGGGNFHQHWISQYIRAISEECGRADGTLRAEALLLGWPKPYRLLGPRIPENPAKPENPEPWILEALKCTKAQRPNIGASITNTILGVPCCNYSNYNIPQDLILVIKALHYAP